MKPHQIMLCALCALITAGCATANDRALQRNKELLRRAHVAVWSRGNLAAADELYAPGYVCHFIAGSEWKGVEGLKAEVRLHHRHGGTGSGAGERTTAGSAVIADRVPDEDADVVRRLKAAGAVLLGKRNMHEFAFGTTSEAAGERSQRTHPPRPRSK